MCTPSSFAPQSLDASCIVQQVFIDVKPKQFPPPREEEQTLESRSISLKVVSVT